ncbi:Sialidase [Lasiosphaeria miniovina]|uniref:Sialidase n=1 Tax=Lasiosphaeria miniovina TaxID=1954250 RepID=A0AA40BER8_9PEZI|nr:Sialidase [Lasiosphaeria miniovina]KAK0732914.1 Sialidase [Lasiosphaeria miniovina]
MNAFSVSLFRCVRTGLALAALAIAATVQNAGNPVVIDRSGVYIRATAMHNGSIVAGYAAADGTAHVLRAAQSNNGGASWTRLGEIWRTDSATHDMDNAEPLVLPSGRILYAFRNHDRVASSGQYTYYRITICYSDDGGRTWLFLSHVDQRKANTNAGANNGLWEPFLRWAADNTLQVYYSSENSAKDQDNLMKYSTDGGATWRGPITVSGGDQASSRDGMTGVADLDGGGMNLICIFESTESGPFTITRVLSSDGGYTWSRRARVYTAGNGKNAGAPQIINVGGALVASFMTNEATDVATIDGGQMKVVTSMNSAAAWSSSGGGTGTSRGAVVTGDRGSHWPGLFVLDSKCFLALYTRDGLGAVSQRYCLA